MLNRRKFLHTTAALGLGALLPKISLASTVNPYEIGIQLYTVRDQFEKNPQATLTALAEMGYKKVELYDYNAGYFGVTPRDMGIMLRTLRMRAPGGHYKYGLHDKNWSGTIRQGWKKAIDDAKLIGHKYMSLGWLDESERTKLDDYKAMAEWLNMAGQMCQNAGIQFCYHNHDFEFQEMEGDTPYDLLLALTEPELVKFEVDLYWVIKAGKDPFAYFEKHPGRFPLWHVKDMDATPAKGFTEVGNGTIDFPQLFAKAKQAGMKHFFVEQDESSGSSLESAKKSLEYLLQMEY